MADHDNGRMGTYAAQRVQNQHAVLHIEASGWFVEQQDARSSEQRTGDRHAAKLATRQHVFAATDLGVQAVGELTNHLDQSGTITCFEQFFCRDVFEPEQQILAHGAGEQHRFLGHQCDGILHGRILGLVDVLTIDRNRAGVGYIQTKQQPQQGGLASTA